MSLEQARALLREGGRVAFPPGLGEPDLVAELPHLLSDRPSEVILPWRTRSQDLRFDASVTVRSLFPGGRIQGGDYLPARLSSVPTLLAAHGELPLDVAIVRVAPVDAAGRHNVGPSATLTAELAAAARIVIAEIDPNLPITNGATFVPAERVTVAVAATEPLELLEEPGAPSGDLLVDLAQHVAGLVPNGAHVQFGLGAAAQAILSAFADHRELRIHAGLLSDAIVSLFESRAADPSWVMPSGEAYGSKALMEYINGNPRLDFQSVRTLHDPRRLASCPHFYTINSVYAVDLLGRASCEGDRQEPGGGIGGLLDFLDGAQLSDGGRNIIVLPSVNRNGASKVVPLLPSDHVSIPSHAIDYVVTEWGAARIRGATRSEISERLIAIAHPDSRAELGRACESQLGKDANERLQVSVD